MNKKITIGLLGAVLNNSNLGCVALTLSLLSILEDISVQEGIEFDYYIFEVKQNNRIARDLAELVNVKRESIHSYQVSSLYGWKSTIKHFVHASTSYRAISRCDLFIDLTAGDSFTDIYGQDRFEGTTKIKELVINKRLPLILGPQTYGPFNKKDNQNRAKKVIERAMKVMTRDQLSTDYIKSFSEVDVITTTDIAFSLPYTKRNLAHDKVNVGVNISSLLISKKTENTETEFSLKANYDTYIRLLLESLNNDPQYKVYIIPHVGEDGGFVFVDDFPDFTYLSPFDNPIDAKSFISGLDVFIGSRMHATIAAFSSGVATIPVGYSRKFLGLFGNLGYKNVIDLQSEDEQMAYKKTISYLRMRDKLKNENIKCMQVAKIKLDDIRTEFKKAILSIDSSKVK